MTPYSRYVPVFGSAPAVSARKPLVSVGTGALWCPSDGNPPEGCPHWDVPLVPDFTIDLCKHTSTP